MNPKNEEVGSPRWHDELPPELMQNPPRKDVVEGKSLSKLTAFLWKHTNFYRMHLLYFILLDLLGAFLIWLTPASGQKIRFIDALYSATSAITCTGLVPVLMGTFSTFGQCVLLFLILLGGQVFTSLLPVLIRRYYFHKTIKEINTRNRKDEDVENAGNLIGESAVDKSKPPSANEESSSHLPLDLAIPTNDGEEITVEASPLTYGISNKRNVKAVAAAYSEANRVVAKKQSGNEAFPSSFTWSGETAHIEGERMKLIWKLIKGDQIAQKEDQNLKEENQDPEKEEENKTGIVQSANLRTEEYKALRTLSWLVPAYYLGIQIFAFLLIRITFWAYKSQRETLRSRNVDATFYSAFQTVSAFGNAGYSLLDLSMIEFQKSVILLTIVGMLILLGNTLYAPAMRLILVLLNRFGSPDFSKEHGLKYLLDNPRKCFTHLFPFHQTLWLTLTVIMFNLVELFFFCVLDWNAVVLEGLSGWYKFADGLFQSLNTRSSGFSVVAIGALSPAMLFLYVGMMYVAVYPVFLSRENARPDKEVVLQRKESHLYNTKEVGVFEGKDMEPNQKSIYNQGMKLLGRDSALLFLCIFVVAIIHASDLTDNPNYSLFSLIFEVISAYGNVGLSLGYTCVPSEEESCTSPPYSFSGVWKDLAKLVICYVMLMGRHRGLPENIDHAVRLPEEVTFEKETIVATKSLKKVADQLEDPYEKYMLLKAETSEERNDILRAISRRVR